MKFITLLLLLLILAAPFPALASSDDGHDVQTTPFEEEFHDPFAEVGGGEAEMDDPLEPLNRISFWVNDKLYRYVLSPFYDIVPSTVRETICSKVASLFSPLKTPQGDVGLKFRDAGSEIGRFALQNLLDWIDPSPRSVAQERPNVEKVLERSGVGEGPYLVIPVVGPSSLRDGLGKVASLYLESPGTLLHTGRDPAEKSLGESLQSYHAICQVALDPYLSIRNLFSQRQEKENRPTFVTARAQDPAQRGARLE